MTSQVRNSVVLESGGFFVSQVRSCDGSVGEKRMANEAVKFVWEGAIPLQIHLHKSEVASHPAPPPAFVTHSSSRNPSFFFFLTFVFS